MVTMDRLKRSRQHHSSSPWHRNLTKSSGCVSTSTASSLKDVSLSECSDELLLHIFQYCSVEDVRHLSCVNHRFRNILFAADVFWWDFCHRVWKWLPDELLEATDSFHVPGVVADKVDETNNMLALLSMAAEKGPPSIDKRALQPVVKNPFCWLRATATDFKLSLREVPTEEGDTAIQYTGPVGEADRSFRSEYPLPHPTLLTHKQLKTVRRYNKLPFFFYKQQNRPVWAPFVSPYIAGHVTNVPRPVVNMTPRLVSYFEVTILPPPQVNNDRESGTVRSRASGGESVGVGLATESFRWYKRMPGWDKFSYGYHGNDGGLYQGSPQLLRPYGPKFGPGDTIGCGLDYQRRSIFFTWHGVFLGYAFEHLSLAELQKDFYPAIGVDSNSPVSCNFGCKKPFVFDLNSMVCHQRKVIMKTLLPTKRNILGKRSTTIAC